MTPLSTRWQHLLARLRDDPAQALVRVVSLARARVLLRGREVGEGVLATGHVRVAGSGRVSIGDQVVLGGGMVPIELRSHRGATLRIGAGCVFNYGASLEAWQSVVLGERCMVASFVRVADRSPGRTAPITIGDDVWLAHGALIEPGVTIGAGSVVSAGAVVTRDVPPGSLAAGNPARCLSLALVVPAGARPAGTG